MTEKAIFFTTGALGDGLTPYTMAEITAWLRRTLGITNGIHFGFANAFSPSVAGADISINTGAATVYGYPYESDSAVLVNIPNPAAATRIDRIVLRASWAAQTVRIYRIAGAEGDGDVNHPHITQTPGTTWDEMICRVQITFPGNVITILADERAYLRYRTMVNAAMIDNRSRSIWVPVTSAYNDSDNAVINRIENQTYGWPLTDAKICSARGDFYVPDEFVSDLYVRAVIISAANGNCRQSLACNYGGDTENASTHSASYAATDVAVVANVVKVCGPLNLAGAAVGDVVGVTFIREGDHVNDTVGDLVYVKGFWVYYMADS